jgi:hypothetical protein
VDGLGALDGFDADFRQADVADVTLLDQVGNGADGLLNGDARVEARRPVDVDVVDAESLQAVGEEVLDRCRAAVEAAPTAAGIAHRAELHREQHLVATAFDGAADEHFIVAHAVEIAGVEEIDAVVDGGVDRGDAFCLVALAIHAGHAHTAEGDGINVETAVAQFALRCSHKFS